MLRADGTFAAHVNLGSLGVADRWADSAVVTWKLDWNHGPSFEGILYDAHRIDFDPERIACYRLLYGLA